MPQGYDAWFGSVGRHPSWRANLDTSPDDDEQLAVTPPDVVAVLGFDPLEFSKGVVLLAEDFSKANPNHDERGRFTTGLSVSTSLSRSQVKDLRERFAAAEEALVGDGSPAEDPGALGYIHAVVESQSEWFGSAREDHLVAFASDENDKVVAGGLAIVRGKEATVEWLGSVQSGGGSAVMANLIDQAKDAGAETLRGQTMGRGAKLNERFGFVQVSGGDATVEPVIMELDLTKVQKANPYHDERGRFTSGPGGAGHPGEGYSSEAQLGEDGKIHTSNVDDAVRALHEDREVVLDQPHKVSVLLDKLSKIAKAAEAAGEKAKNYDLCNVNVKGSNLFCAGHKGLSRVEMPQLKGVPLKGSRADSLPRDIRGEVDLAGQFREHLASKGYAIEDDNEGASFLRSTQNELNGVKVAGIATAIRDNRLADERLFVSRDNYIVDGHHRWAAMVGVDFDDNKPGDLSMKVARVDTDIITLLDESRRFAADWGIPQQGVGEGAIHKFNPNHDERGRFTTAGGGAARLTSSLPDYTPAPAASAAELFNRTYDPKITVDQVLDSFNDPSIRAAVMEAEAKIRAGVDTQSQYLGPDGVYTPERVVVHEKIMDDIFTPDAVARATPAEGEQPTFTVLGGRGGAGKSWFTSEEGPASKDAMYLNSDDIKAALPEYEGWNAGLLHQESSDLVSRANHVAKEAGLSVVYDATMRSDRTIDRMIDEYKAAGYRVEGYFMHTAPHVSAVRATARFKKSGRYVPPGLVLSSTTNEANFDKMSRRMDKWAVYDNNSGRGPQLIVSKG